MDSNILEQRVAALETEVTRLKALLEEKKAPEPVGWRRIIGSFADDPVAFEEAMRLGREWRESFRPKTRSPKKKSQKSKSSDGHP